MFILKTVFFVFQTSSYGSCASKKGEPDIQCRREASFGKFQPRGKIKKRVQNIVTAARDGAEKDGGKELVAEL